jgi:hypothetical protein
VENLSGNARSEFRREFDELNNLQAVIGCKRHMVSLSWKHVMGLSEMTALPKRLFSSPGVFQHSSSFSHSLPTHTPPHINSYHTCSTPSPLQSTSPDSSILTMGFEKGTFFYAANVIQLRSDRHAPGLYLQARYLEGGRQEDAKSLNNHLVI